MMINLIDLVLPMAGKVLMEMNLRVMLRVKMMSKLTNRIKSRKLIGGI